MILIMIVCIEFHAHYVCFSHSVFFKKELKHGATRSVAYSLLTLNKLLGSCNKQEKEIDVKIHFSLKIVLVLTWLI